MNTATMAMSPSDVIQGFDGFPISRGKQVHDFGEYTFRAPRPGFFVGDSPEANEHRTLFQHRDHKSLNQRVPTSRQSLGPLDALPNELLCEIFLHLDICSLLLLWRMDQRFKTAIENWPSFRTMVAFPKLLSATEALQCRSWTIEKLLYCIQDERCISCGHFGDLLYLVTPERWCYHCFLERRASVPERSKCLSQAQVDIARRLVPSVWVVPGWYGWNSNGIVRAPMRVFDQRALQRLPPDAGEWPITKPDRGHPLYYVAMIRAPYWDTSTLRFEEGLFCRACASQGWIHRDYGGGLGKMWGRQYPIWGLPWRRYSRKGMQDHLEQYGAILKLQWVGGETRYVHEKPFERWTWYEPKELARMESLLTRCREKKIEFPVGQPFIYTWDHVSSEKEVES